MKKTLKKTNGFSLAEMLIVMLVLTILLAAMMPVLTKRQKISTEDGLWHISPDNSADIYSRQTDDSVAIVGSVSRYGDESDAGNLTRGKFRINSPIAGYPQLGFMFNGKGVGSLYVGPKHQIYLGTDLSNYEDKGSNGSEIIQNLGENAIRIGGGSTNSTSGDNSINIGNASEARSIRTISIGENVAEGDGAISIGGLYSSSTETDTTTKFGAFGANSLTIGNRSIIKGSESIAIGAKNNVIGNYSVAIGNTTYADNYSIAIGYQASVKSEGGIAIGENATANSSGAIALGKGTTATGTNAVAIGAGASSTTNTITLGTSSFYVEVPGTIIATNLTCKSDIRLKNIKSENIDGLDKIKQLSVFNYNFKNDKSKKMHVGVIAQDLQKVFPQAISKDSKGFLLIRTEDIFYAMVNSIKELDTKISKINSNIKNITLKQKLTEKKIKILSKKYERLNNQLYALKQENKRLKQKLRKS